MTNQEIRNVLKLEVSYKAELSKNEGLTLLNQSYKDELRECDRQIDTYLAVIETDEELIQSLELTVSDQASIIATERRKVKLLKFGLIAVGALIPTAAIMGAIYLPL